MAEDNRSDHDDLERAPEEAAIETWVEESGVYLRVPGSEPVRQTIDVGVSRGGQSGGAGD